MRTGGTALQACGVGERRVPADAAGGGGPGVSQLLAGDMCVVRSTVMPGGGGDDDGDVDSTTATSKKGANMTERVPVPSSEHVAEIVGRQGCKIKALRNKTNTYIKTPVRGEEPVFVVTGRQQDVDAARREIVSAAEHFTQIRASRRHHAGKVHAGTTARRRSPSPGRPSNHRSPGTVPSTTTTTTLGVRVPMSMVGLVVGPKGATIKRIQADTGTYIVTPGRDRDPVFEVIGSPDAVERARQHIDAYIETRLQAATSTTDRRELSFVGPVAAVPAGEIWSAGELDSVSSRFDLVDNRDAISRLLALSADYGRPPPPTTPAWQLPQPSPPAWSSCWPLAVDEDAQLAASLYGVQSAALTRGRSDADELVSTLYARLLIAEKGGSTQLPTRDDVWSVEGGLSPGCEPLGVVGGGMTVNGGSAETGSFIAGPDDDDDSGRDNDISWKAFSGFFDRNFFASRLRAVGADSAGAWRLRPDVDVSAAVVVGGSDGALSLSCSPAESSTGSTA